MIYNTSLAVLFGIKHYADALWRVVSERDIRVNLRTNLVEVLPKENKAVFENLDDPYQNSVLDVSKCLLNSFPCIHIDELNN